MTGPLHSTLGDKGKGKTLCEEDKKYVIRRYTEGAFIRQIAMELGRSSGPVKRCLKEGGLI